MSGRARLALGGGIGAVFAAWFFFAEPRQPPVLTETARIPAAMPAEAPALAPEIGSKVEPNASVAPVSGPGVLRTESPLARELNAPGKTAQEDVECLHTILRQYQRRLHRRQGLPIGDDIDLAKVLTGKNPMKAVLIPPNHPALTRDGHLRDRWGTPYFIHPRGYGAFEVRSAGPDRKLFTADDAIANPLPGRDSEAPPDEPRGLNPEGE